MKKINKSFLLPAFTGVVLILLFGYYLPVLLAVKPPRYRQVDVILFTGRMEGMYRELYKIPYHMLRNYQDIHITGEQYKDNIKLDFARIRIHEIIQQQDTLNGVHISFGDSARFNMFIRALDILTLERAQRYIIDKGEIWFFEDMP